MNPIPEPDELYEAECNAQGPYWLCESREASHDAADAGHDAGASAAPRFGRPADPDDAIGI